MRQSMRLTVVGLAVAAVAAMAGVVLNPAAALADVPGSFATTNRGSDPHMIACTDTLTGTNGFCLYTTVDMGQRYAYPPANYYPMQDIKVYFSPNGFDQWTFRAYAFRESQLDVWNVPRRNCAGTGAATNAATGEEGAGNCRQYHLWAPSVVKSGSTYYLFVPDVTDTDDQGNSNIHNRSRIAVATSTDPLATFTYQGTVDSATTYMSDPDVVIDGSNRYLVWADGDNGTCGGLSSAKLGTDFRTVAAGTAQTLSINGLSVLGNCGGTGRPYLEGASLYKRSFKPGTSWTLFFAAKPTSTPTECTAANTPAGSANTANEVIAWASATSAQGPYTYEGIVMCGSTTEWTNQATVTTIANGNTTIVYHDSAANVKERFLHAECLYYGGGKIGGVYRQALSGNFGFNECNSPLQLNTAYVGLWGQDPQQPSKPTIMSVESGQYELIAKRYAVGPWERYRFQFSNGAYQIQALANGKFLCAATTATPFAPSCLDPAVASAQLTMESVGNGQFRLKSTITNRWLSIGADGRIYPSATSTADAAVFARLSPTG